MDVATTRRGGSAGCSRPTATGAVFDEACTETQQYVETAYVILLARGDVADVSVAGAAPIATESNSTLPDGLRGVAVELPGYKLDLQPGRSGYLWSPCPRVRAFAANGKPIDERGRIGKPTTVELPRRHWRAPARPPRGVCELTAARLPDGIRALEGTVATALGRLPALADHAFTGCAETSYIDTEGHELPAVVLLDAVHPGAKPPDLPGMEPLAGHPGIFELPTHVFVRRIPGAWLAVKEEDTIGPREPVALLEALRATVRGSY
ncbi:MAG TPA: hypothetical protein VGY13_03190 [Solirubrobacteraceae bacterium]|jgi:hypothetical protein|nr:hypothetical protein [Solirubrobacteraceae bacterium]